jgi:hypothetical protein
MLQPHPVTLVGFSAFERNVLTSAIRLSERRHAAYMLVDRLDEARFIVADTDSAGTLEGLQTAGRLRDTVFIGAQAPEHAPAWMMRPIDAAKVLLELDVMVARGAASGLSSSSALVEPHASRRPHAAQGPGRRASDASVG